MPSVQRDLRQVNVRATFESGLAKAHADLLKALDQRIHQL